jgi:hypothetical protein
LTILSYFLARRMFYEYCETSLKMKNSASNG